MMDKKITPMPSQKAGRTANKASAALTAAAMLVRYPYVSHAAGSGMGNSFGVSVDMDTLSQNFADPNQIMGVVVGLALWICQIVGVCMLIWGIYGYVTARKDGEPEAMNGALGKLVSGAVLIGMKGILQMMGIVS